MVRYYKLSCQRCHYSWDIYGNDASSAIDLHSIEVKCPDCKCQVIKVKACEGVKKTAILDFENSNKQLKVKRDKQFKKVREAFDILANPDCSDVEVEAMKAWISSVLRYDLIEV